MQKNKLRKDKNKHFCLSLGADYDHNYGYISTDMKIHEKLQNLFPWQPPAIKGNIPQGDMPGDQAQGFGDLGPKAENYFPRTCQAAARNNKQQPV